jgi:hypothetical protein
MEAARVHFVRRALGFMHDTFQRRTYVSAVLVMQLLKPALVKTTTTATMKMMGREGARGSAGPMSASAAQNGREARVSAGAVTK